LQADAINSDQWQCNASTAEMYDNLLAAMQPFWTKMYERQGVPGAFWCALYQVRTPIATFIWDKFVCPTSAQSSPIPFVSMPSSTCKRLRKFMSLPPSELLPIWHIGSINRMFPAAFDFHPFGLFIGKLLVQRKEGIERIMQLFPIQLCGEAAYRRHTFSFQGETYGFYAVDCPHNIAIHSMMAQLVSQSPEPLRMPITPLFDLKLAWHGFGHGLIPRYLLRDAVQICQERGSDECEAGVAHSFGNRLRPRTGLRQFQAWVPWCANERSLCIRAARGYILSANKQNATFGRTCGFDYFRPLSSLIDWAETTASKRR